MDAVYCDSCGQKMNVRLGRFHEYKCCHCGNTYTSHGDNVFQRHDKGRRKHYQVLMDQLTKARGEWKDRVRRKVATFKKEELGRINRIFSQAGWTREKLAKLTPFGLDLFDENHPAP